MSRDVVVPGARDVRATLDGPAQARGCVVACPPHPQHGGSRSDGRLRAVADALAERGLACLRFDYGDWDEGRGERADAEGALSWAAERYDAVGLFGYSFGAAVALVAAAADAGPAVDGGLCAVAVLAPPDHVDALEALPAVEAVGAPLLVCYGERDETVEWGPVVEAAGATGASVEAFPGDHFFFGAEDRVGETVAAFLADHCG